MPIVKWLGERRALRLVEAVMLVTIVMVAYLTYLQQQQVDCNRRYNERTSQVTKARSEAADQRAEALAEAIAASLRGDEEYRREAQEYLDAWAKEKQTREKNPLVPPPSDYCG